MKTMRLLLAAVMSAGLAFGTAKASEPMVEAVQLESLPVEVQKTIKEKAAAGEIVSVHREDDKNGKWNYEVVVKTDGKEWGFEVSPNGKYLKKHDDHTNKE